MGVTLGKGMRRTVQTVGGVFALISLVLLLVAVTTNQWLTISVDRSGVSAQASTELASYPRTRGLYRECWAENSLNTQLEENDYYSSDSCLHFDMRVLDIRPSLSYSSDYKARAGLLVTMWAVFGLSALFSFIALMLYFYTMCQHVNNYQWKYGCKASAGLMFAGALCNVFGMALYHGAEYMELNTVEDPSGLQAPYPLFFAKDMPETLISQTSRNYNWSYALSWCAVACELLSSVLFMSVSCCYVKSKKSKSTTYAKPIKQNTVVIGQRNSAYERTQERVVIAPPKVYVVQNDYYQNRRGTYDPYSNGQPMNSYSPQYSYENGWTVQ